MDYVGDSLVFQFSEVSNNIGCVSPHSVLQVGQMGFWYSDSGFIMWDGARLKPIGQERIDRTFAENYDIQDWPHMSTAVDMKNNVVMWSLQNQIFAYNWVLDRWSVIDIAAPIIFSGYTPSANPAFYVFDSSYNLGSLIGDPMEAEIGLGELELAPGRDARLTSIRPITDATSDIVISVKSRQRLGDDAAENLYSELTDGGDMPVRERGRYVQMSQIIESGANWTYAQGLDLAVTTGARR
jgi:hypothetical protein